jgi:glycosyltransferase involved in cell wall biosynthesis
MNVCRAAFAVSVVTPTYNRARLLGGVFESLRSQTFRDFEWIVIDDGSTDNTKFVVEDFAQRANFPVRYFWKENGGKHTAMNMSYEFAAGELLLAFDSDDRCLPDALEFMVARWRELVPRYPDLAGIVTSCITSDGRPLGTRFPTDGEVGRLHKVYDRLRLRGDRWDIHRTSILRQFPFPTAPGQRLCPEGLVWNRMSQRYRMAFFNHATRIHEYLEDGYTANLGHARRMSPTLFKLYHEETLDLDISLFSKWRAASNYVRASIHEGSVSQMFFKRPIASICGGVLGTALALTDILLDQRKRGVVERLYAFISART